MTHTDPPWSFVGSPQFPSLVDCFTPDVPFVVQLAFLLKEFCECRVKYVAKLTCHIVWCYISSGGLFEQKKNSLKDEFGGYLLTLLQATKGLECPKLQTKIPTCALETDVSWASTKCGKWFTSFGNSHEMSLNLKILLQNLAELFLRMSDVL